MANAKLTPAQAASLIVARSYTDDARKDTKASIFAAVKGQFGIPTGTKLKVEIDDTSSPDYLVLKNKHTGATFTVPDAPVQQVATPAAANPSPAIQALDAQVADQIPAPGTRLVVVDIDDVFFGAGEVVVRIPA